ncbi:sialidase-like isoform X2 [Triplophysa rosa]|uniref:sialidase-like isoform X2 n=1 Tax=Triplophysa rosa TaxID=992332 RepID=UPI002545D5BB|nr:sialidase-like isoform X2 [Triplophysa rosa]
MMNVLLLFSCIITVVVGAPVSVTGHRGETVHITCPYESGYETNKKYLCKGDCRLVNKDIIVESGSPAKGKRFSLIDDKTARVFTVTITDLRTKDEGNYSCGVSTSYLLPDQYSEIILLVKLDEKITGQPTKRHTVQPTKHPVAITQSYFSKSVFNLQSTGIKPKDQSLSSTVSVVYISIGLTLIVIGLLVALTVICKKKNGGKKSPTVTQSGPSDQVSAVHFLPESTPADFNYCDHEYQEIGELQLKNVNSTITMYSTGPADSTPKAPVDSMIYTTVQTPADSMNYSTSEAPADSTIYSTAESPVDSTIHSTAESPIDSTIYSTAETPVDSTIYSTAESPADSTIYSTAESPVDSTIYSTAETPADSMNYSTSEAPVESTIYSTAETPVDSTIYSTAETPVDSTIYSTAESPIDSTIYSTAESPIDSTIYSTALL